MQDWTQTRTNGRWVGTPGSGEEAAPRSGKSTCRIISVTNRSSPQGINWSRPGRRSSTITWNVSRFSGLALLPAAAGEERLGQGPSFSRQDQPAPVGHPGTVDDVPGGKGASRKLRAAFLCL